MGNFMNNKKSKGLRYFCSTLAIILAMSGVMPATGGSFYTYADAGIYFTDVSLSINNAPVDSGGTVEGPFKDGDTVSLEYSWKIDDNHALNGGETLVVDLPAGIFADAEVGDTNLMADLTDAGEPTKIGSWNVDAGKLTLIFDALAGDYSNVHGAVRFEQNFSLKQVRVDEPYELKFPISGQESKTFTIQFGPKGDSPSIEKNGVPNSNKINWTIDINKDLKTVPAEDALVLDTLDSRLSLIDDTLQIFKLNVYSDGTVNAEALPLTIGSDYTLGITPSTDVTQGDQLSVQFRNQLTGAYRITYSTKANPDRIDTSQTSFTYKNTAVFSGKTVEPTVTVAAGKIIEKLEEKAPDDTYKSSVFNTKTLDWEIKVNEANYPLKSVRVEDVIPVGLSIGDIDKDVKIFSETTGQEVTNNSNITKSYADQKLTVTFGDIHEEYIIKISTALDPEFLRDSNKFKNLSVTNNGNYYAIKFKNTATLYQTQGAAVTATDSQKIVTVKEGKLIYKKGTADIKYNNEKYINWHMLVNLAEIDTKTNVIKDIVGSGQLIDSSHPIKITPLKIAADGTLTDGVEIPTSEYVVNYGSDNKMFDITFNNPITQAYRIHYRTLVTDYSQTKFENTGVLGSLTSIGTVKTSINNEFTKDAGKVNYLTGEIPWTIMVNPIREKIEELIITDTFSRGHMMKSSQFDAIVIKSGGDPLIKGTQYTITPEKDLNDTITGFTINFKETSYTLNNAVYTVNYVTQIDPNEFSKNDDLLDYSNKVEFKHLGNTVELGSAPTINPIAKLNGQKTGSLDLNKKQINWDVNLNYLSKNITGLEVTDQIEMDAQGNGQKLTPGSVQVYSYKVDKDGKIEKSSTPVDLTDAGIVITEDSAANKFTVKFNKLINTPYGITYSTDLVGISKKVYSNTAQTNNGDSYTGTVQHTDGDKFVGKTGARGTGSDSGYVNWEIIINKSKSTIDKMTLTDTMSAGLLLESNSFKLFRVKNTNETSDTPLVFADYFNVVPHADNLLTGPQGFDLVSKKTIDNTLKIQYKSKISFDDIINTKFENTVNFVGEKVEYGTREVTTSITHSILTGSGWAVGELGSLTLVKQDADDASITLQGAKFKLFKGSKELGTLITDANGEIKVSNLKYGTYSLKEVEAPANYQITSSDAVEFVINKENPAPIKTVTNHKLGVILIQKVDSNDLLKVLSGAQFEVRDSNEQVVGTVTTDATGKATIYGLKFGTYSIKETQAPSGYYLNTQSVNAELNAKDHALRVQVGDTKIPPTPEPTTGGTPRDDRADRAATTVTPIDIPVQPVPQAVPTPTKPAEPIKPALVPIGDNNPTGVPVLPKTSELPMEIFYGLGGLLIFIGAVMKTRKTKMMNR